MLTGLINPLTLGVKNIEEILELLIKFIEEIYDPFVTTGASLHWDVRNPEEILQGYFDERFR